MLQARLAPTAERLARAEDPYIRYALKALTDVVVETLGQLFSEVWSTPRDSAKVACTASPFACIAGTARASLCLQSKGAASLPAHGCIKI